MSSPMLAALVGIGLAFPLMLLYTSIAFDLEPVERLLKSVLTDDGDQPNVFGRIFMIGALVLLPIGFVVNLLPLVRPTTHARLRTIYLLNIVVGLVLLVYLSQTWGALIMEGIACVRGVPGCD